MNVRLRAGLLAVVAVAAFAPAGALAATPLSVAVRGQGSSVRSISLPRGGIVIVTASNTGSSNFDAELLRPGGDRIMVVNEIGPVTAARSVEGQVTVGRYKLAVEAEGAWAVRFIWPLAHAEGVPAPGPAVAGRGSGVFRIHAARSLFATVRVSNSGSSNVVVTVYGIPAAGTTGSDMVVNEIGPGRWSGAIDAPRGDYLVGVQAEGAWNVRFTP